MTKKIIVRIGNGFGNQMFNYAAAYAFSKKFKYELLIDDESSHYSDLIKSRKKKYLHWFPKYELDIFKISSRIADNKYKFNSGLKIIFKKILEMFNFFLSSKIFLFEKKDTKKISKYDKSLFDTKFSNLIFIEGYFETEKYFIEYKNDLLKEFEFKKTPTVNNKYLNDILNSNSVSIAVRRDRFSERYIDQNDTVKLKKTEDFDNITYEYIFNAVKYFENKYSDCKFFLFSDDFKDLDKIFDPNKFCFINENISNKSLEDFYLMRKCKNFIVGPTSYHWWAAWLSEGKNSICTYPSKINPSNNLDFWPSKWISI